MAFAFEERWESVEGWMESSDGCLKIDMWGFVVWGFGQEFVIDILSWLLWDGDDYSGSGGYCLVFVSKSSEEHKSIEAAGGSR